MKGEDKVLRSPRKPNIIVLKEYLREKGKRTFLVMRINRKLTEIMLLMLSESTIVDIVLEKRCTNKDKPNSNSSEWKLI